jgi:hypothetical protein
LPFQSEDACVAAGRFTSAGIGRGWRLLRSFISGRFGLAAVIGLFAGRVLALPLPLYLFQ